MPRLKPAIYDGDTPTEQRWQIRKWSNVILTNPDMVHVGLLPNHDRWGDVLANLRYVVVDEAHVYRGVFGSHVANVLRRLRRLARIYGAEPQFLLASATISNPGELATALLGEQVTVVGDDAAPRSERTVVLWNPPLQDAELGLRGSPLAEAARLQAMFVERGLRTLTFAKSRKAAELIHRFTAERLGDDAQLSPYRAGYTAQQRRDIERRLKDGELLGVSATNALELGIDVGLLDCVISVGFPGTVASLRQQWGRAGRRGSGLAVLVASEDGLDQFFMREPDKLLGRRVEAAILDHANPRVLRGHVRSAAYEAPLTDEDAALLGPEALELAREDPELRSTPAGIVWGGTDHPASRVALRSADPDAFSIVDGSTGAVLGMVERSRAYSTVHEGAIYLHLGESFLVRELNLNTLYAVVEPFTGDWYTQAKKDTMTQIVAPRTQRAAPRARPALRRDRGDRAGRRLRAAHGQLAGADRARAARAAADDVRDRGDLVPARAVPARRARRDAEAARNAARRRARADRAAAAVGDVRPLGHRRPLDEHPSADRPPDGVRLRRACRRRRDHRARLRAVRGLGARHRRDDPRAARARTAAPRASRARSAATSTTCSTRTAR